MNKVILLSAFAGFLMSCNDLKNRKHQLDSMELTFGLRRFAAVKFNLSIPQFKRN